MVSRSLGFLRSSALHTSRASADALGLPPLPMRSARRTRPDYVIGRLALHDGLTRVHGVSRASAKQASLLLRRQILQFAAHDLAFVGSLGEAERTISLGWRWTALESRSGSLSSLAAGWLQLNCMSCLSHMGACHL